MPFIPGVFYVWHSGFFTASWPGCAPKPVVTQAQFLYHSALPGASWRFLALPGARVPVSVLFGMVIVNGSYRLWISIVVKNDINENQL
jgi:hypothetical protein